MKVFHLTKTIYGGSGQYTFRLSNGLNDLGNQSTVFVSEGESLTDVSVLSSKASPIRQLANRTFLSMMRRATRDPYHSGFRLDRWIRSQISIAEADIVHLHGMTGWTGFEGLKQLIPANVPVFWTAHDLWLLSGGCVVYQGCDRFQTGCSNCPIIKAPFSRWSHHEWKRKAQFIEDYQIIPIANSRWVADKIKQSPFFKHISNREIPIIPPIVEDVFFKVGKLLSLRDELKISDNRIIVGLSARALTDHYKGIPEFIQRFSREVDLVHSCTLLVCGDGEIDVPSSVDCRFLGALTDSQSLARFYHNCDVFVSPSRMETFGMTLLEAQAAKTPVVVFRVGGTPEALCEQQQSYLAEAGNESDLIFKLRELLSDRTRARKIGTEASQWVHRQFSSAAVAQRQADLYREMSYFFKSSET